MASGEEQSVRGRRSTRALAVLLALGGCEAAEAPGSAVEPSSSSAPETATPDLPASEATGTVAPQEPAVAPQELAVQEILPPPVEPPIDFGSIRPPSPPPDASELTVHALAGFEVVSVHMRPDLASPRMGYLRIGTRTMVTPRIDDQGEGCAKGFHALPAGGFACASKGLIVDPEKPPYMYKPPPPPRIDAPIPYDYGVIGQDGTPMWWRIPDAEEIMLAGQRYRALVAAQEAAAPAPAAKARSKAAPESPAPESPAPDSPAPDSPAAGADASAPPLPGVADVEAPPPVELTAEEKAAIARREAAARKRAAERKKEEQERERALARKRARLPLNSQTPFMEAGFVVTLGDKIREGGQAWWKTTRGGFVQASRAWRKQTTDFHGGEVPADARFAFGFVAPERGASAAVRGADGALKWKRRLEHRQFLAFVEEVEVGGKPYLVTADGHYVRRGDLRLAAPATRPEAVQPWERWIDVDLERQLLVAYEGDTPVYATLVSSGKRGTAEESFLTPKGKFRISAKHISSSMDGNAASDGRYSIQDVPWAMFFSGNYALHGAFWHQKFGERRSHGCVNLGPSDARWLFFWTTPFVPAGWHGVVAHDGAPGSMVVIH